MPVEVIMPKVDMDMAKGKIVTWYASEGDFVTKGAPLFDIETDKAAMEIEAPDSGILHHPAPEGTDVPIGKPVAWLYAEGEAVGAPPASYGAEPAAASPAPAPVSEPEPARAEAVAPAPRGDVALSDKQRATPRARALAREAGLDLDGIPGTGPRGRVQAEDVQALLDRAPAFAAPVAFSAETGPLSVTRTKGGTGTPVVLIHGFASDATSWAPLEAQLKHRPIIRIELPGHGKSPKLRIANFAALVKDVRRAFDDLNLEQVHLVGHSLGGALALAIADTRERSIASLTLIAPAGLGPEVNGDALSGICRANRPESLGPWLRRLVADETIITDSYVRLAMAGRADPNLRAAQSALAEVLFPDGVQAFDLRAALERIAVPTRILWGKQDDIIPWHHALRAPGRAALHLFGGVGHMPQIECADEVGQLIKAYI
ncbi:acetoin dehydrogenase dihydrolipoyllysine-residue acetyltransferase subunit [Defluviimonas sp. WL0075]|uniref:Acetoin dehydrogenase dihydrolipoyllysine-residue acetyltransferase subunit n=1 Tax=Albidovulum sediminicola TaxID=2984331 RepID=A0ABT2Z6W0_9RHOB|nr:acetoin dehydrogenase dihydrolipoyllysine-residue acetyltransferase subunit [Defluviimonas sp. WL0075]MCV2866825.1 acetoin dehydrogenase dihydrolipoyllysine-residue acetyltransferase subunit [Defluviimonas sp. WL0075]